MALIGWVLLLFLAVLPALATSSAHLNGNLTLRCHPDQAASLLQLKKSFSFFRYPNPLESWLEGTDCCLWEGVGCSNSSGHVTAIELSDRGLHSPGLDPAIFNLASLQRLDLSMNNFGGYGLPASGFESLSLLTHLNLSNSGFQGQIPIGIGRLASLISLDLSCNYATPEDSAYVDYTTFNDNGDYPGIYGFDYFLLRLKQPNFQNLVSNLHNLRELYLDRVDMSSTAHDWCHSLAKSLPDLRVLSLSYCYLNSPICPSLSTLHSLTVVNLERNSYMPVSPFPEFFMNFSNLSVLKLAMTNLQGWFPHRTFQSKTLRVLDLSGNQDLSGQVPNLSNASSIEIMMLGGTNITFAKPGSFNNFKYLKALSLDVNFVPVKPQPSLGILRSLQHLKLSQMDYTRNLWPILSWIEDLQNLRSLELYGGNCSLISLSSVVKLKSLRSLAISHCSFTKTELSTLRNLVDLGTLEIYNCILNGPIPSAIGNLTNLRSLKIIGCDFLGSIPSSIGNLRNLRNMEINCVTYFYGTPDGSSRPLPAAIGNLSNLESLDINYCGFSGPIPDEVGLLKKLTVLRIGQCSLSGRIPNSIVNLTHLIDLDLSSNLLNGELRTSIFAIRTLQRLDINSNLLSGSIQDFEATSSHMLHTLDLNNNKIEGDLPMTLTKCLQLEFLDVGNNHMVGTFPSWLGKLPRLRVLILRSNQFYGPMGGNLHGDENSGEDFSTLQILDLASNNFSGNLSTKWFVGLKSMMAEFNTTGDIVRAYNGTDYQDVVTITYKSIYRSFDKILTTLTLIDLSDNSFDGTVPESLGRLISLLGLNMSGNAFTGVIPQEFGGMTLLESLDLSRNQLSGDIPEALTNLTFLGILNLSNNQLVGRIPKSTQFSTFQNRSFEGNPGLCGPPLRNPCGVSFAPPSQLHLQKSSDVDVVLFLFVGLGFGVGFAAAILMRWGRISKRLVKSVRALRT
ncbi:hypothetical protein ACQ4PT_016753 [Festuca glaucescens]